MSETAKPLTLKRRAGLRSSSVVLILLLAASFAFLSYLSLVVFRNYPFCMDEYNYWYQAKIFASGHRYLSIQKELYPLVEKFMVLTDGKLFSRYTPGWPVLLTIGTLLGVPGLVNPLLSVLCLWLIYKLVATYLGRNYALFTVLLLATNSYFLCYGGSFFSHTASLLFCTLALYFHRLYQLRPSARLASITGALVGLTIWVRPLDALCVFLALAGSWIFISLKKLRLWDFPLFVFTAALGGLSLFAYNASLLGNWTVAVYPIWTEEFRIYFPAPTFYESLASMLNFLRWSVVVHNWPNMIQFFLPKLGYAIVLVCLIAFFSRKRARLYLYAAVILLFMLLYTFHPGPGWHIYGFRYWYPTLPCIAILLSHGLAVLRNARHRWLLPGIIILILVLNLVQLSADLKTYSLRFQIVDLVQADILRECPEKSIVVLDAPENWDASVPWPVLWADLLRNPYPFGPRLYVQSLSRARLVQPYFPDYKICIYHFKSVSIGDGVRPVLGPTAQPSGTIRTPLAE
jgi:hypothetical protein